MLLYLVSALIAVGAMVLAGALFLVVVEGLARLAGAHRRGMDRVRGMRP